MRLSEAFTALDTTCCIKAKAAAATEKSRFLRERASTLDASCGSESEAAADAKLCVDLHNDHCLITANPKFQLVYIYTTLFRTENHM